MGQQGARHGAESGGINRRSVLKGAIGLAALPLVPSLLAACSDDNEAGGGGGGSAGGGGGGGGGGGDGRSLIIGSMPSLSGALAPYGQIIQNGLELAVEQINANGGILGQPIEVRTEDTASSPDTGLQVARKLIEQDGVDVLFGAEGSDIRNAVVSYTSGQGIPFMYPANYEGGHYDDFLFCFNAVPSQEFSDAFFESILELADGDTRWFHVSSDFSYGQRSGEWVNRQAEKFGIEIIEEQYIPFSQTDLSSNVARIKGAAPAVLLNNVVGETAINLQRAMDQEGILSDMVVAGSAYDQSIAAGMGASGNGGRRALQWNNDVEGQATADFVAAYEEKYGDAVMSYMTESSYGVPFFLKAAYEAVGEIDAEKVAAELPGTTQELPSGTVTVRDDHHVDLTMHLFRVEDGALVTEETFGKISPGIDQREEGAF